MLVVALILLLRGHLLKGTKSHISCHLAVVFSKCPCGLCIIHGHVFLKQIQTVGCRLLLLLLIELHIHLHLAILVSGYLGVLSNAGYQILVYLSVVEVEVASVGIVNTLVGVLLLLWLV